MSAKKRQHALDSIVGFVEGRLSPKEFWSFLYADSLCADMLLDEGGIASSSVVGGTCAFVMTQDYENHCAVSVARGALAGWLDRHDVDYQIDTKSYEQYEALLDAQPAWLDVAGDYFSKLLLESGGIEGRELRQWLKKEIRSRFTSVKRPPRWIQNPAWPIGPNGPLVFLGQLSVGEHLHDSGFAYVFLDPTDGSCKTVIQVH